MRCSTTHLHLLGVSFSDSGGDNLNDNVRRFTAAFLAVVLFFAVCFPVPITDDDIRYGQAYGYAGSAAAYAALGTIAAVAGLYFVATTDQDYQTAVANTFDSLCTQLNVSGASLESTLEGYANSKGEVNMAAVDPSIISGLSSLANAGYQGGTVIEGDNSLGGPLMYLSNVYFLTDGVEPDLSVFPANNQPPAGSIYLETIVQSNGNYRYVYMKSMNTFEVKNTSSGSGGVTRLNSKSYSPGRFPYWSFDSEGNYLSYYTGASIGINDYRDTSEVSHVNPAVPIIYGSDLPVRAVVADGVSAVATPALLSGAATVSGVYDIFSPTAAQLEAGYSVADVVEAVNNNTGTVEGIGNQLEDVLSGVASLSTTLSGINALVNTISTTFSGLAQSPFAWLQSWWNTLSGWWAQLLAWLGASPFGTVMGTVISGVQAIPDGIRQLGDDITAGLDAIPGAIEGILNGDLVGVLEGILDGILDIPASIATDLAGVIDAIQSAVAELVAGLSAATFSFQWPGLPTFSGSGSVGLPSGMGQGLETDLRDKVPFCYLLRSRDAVVSMINNFSSNRSFYFDLDIPFSNDRLHFDAEPFLSQRFGGLDIAQTVRVLVTWLLCLGLLYRSYKIVERTAF